MQLALLLHFSWQAFSVWAFPRLSLSDTGISHDNATLFEYLLLPPWGWLLYKLPPLGMLGPAGEFATCGLGFDTTVLGFVATGLGFVATGLGFVATGLGFVATGLGFVATGLEFVATGLGFVTAGLGFIIDGLGFIIDGLGFIIDGLGFVTAGLGFIIDGLGFIIDGLGFVTTGLGFVIDGLGFVTAGLGFITDGIGPADELVTGSLGVLGPADGPSLPLGDVSVFSDPSCVFGVLVFGLFDFSLSQSPWDTPSIRQKPNGSITNTTSNTSDKQIQQEIAPAIMICCCFIY